MSRLYNFISIKPHECFSEWCGNSSFVQSGYAGTTNEFSSLNVAAYFSEFGNAACTRTWTEVEALFGPNMTGVWSGGLAFSYFPAASAAGQFGIVTISSDGSNVTTSNDFTALAAEYAAISPPNSPLESGAGSPQYPGCPGDNTTFLASTTLPPTPNDQACQCLESSLNCQFTPPTNNYTSILGPLIDTACGLLSQQGGNCNSISSSGATGTYGPVSGCDPSKSPRFIYMNSTHAYPLLAIKLSFIFTQYYLGSNKNAQACSFNGNGTINPLAPPAVSAANAAGGVIDCILSLTFLTIF